MKINGMSAFKMGFQLSAGAALFIAAASIVLNLLGPYFHSTDNSDKSRFERSGFTIMTDHLTGVEYLKSGCALIERKKP